MLHAAGALGGAGSLGKRLKPTGLLVPSLARAGAFIMPLAQVARPAAACSRRIWGDRRDAPGEACGGGVGALRARCRNIEGCQRRDKRSMAESAVYFFFGAAMTFDVVGRSLRSAMSVSLVVY